MAENKNAKTPADGPVAWGCQCGRAYTVTCISSKPAKHDYVIDCPRCGHCCPERTWVGLTDEDIHDAFNFTEMVKQLSWDREPEQWCENFAAYIEARLKERNG